MAELTASTYGEVARMLAPLGFAPFVFENAFFKTNRRQKLSLRPLGSDEAIVDPKGYVSYVLFSRRNVTEG